MSEISNSEVMMDQLKIMFIQLQHLVMSQTGANPIDPNMGTAVAYQNAQKRLQDPTIYDAIFPVIAFFLVIVLPVLVAFWVIFKTVTEKEKGPNET